MTITLLGHIVENSDNQQTQFGSGYHGRIYQRRRYRDFGGVWDPWTPWKETSTGFDKEGGDRKMQVSTEEAVARVKQHAFDVHMPEEGDTPQIIEGEQDELLVSVTMLALKLAEDLTALRKQTGHQ